MGRVFYCNIEGGGSSTSIHRANTCFYLSTGNVRLSDGYQPCVVDNPPYKSRMIWLRVSSSSRKSRLSCIFFSTLVTEYMTVVWSRLNFFPMSL